MLKKILNFLLISLLLTNPIAFAQPPQNLYYAKQRLIEYHQSGQYKKDVKQVIARARNYLHEVARKLRTQKLAIVFDIDETTLSNYQYIKARQFGGTNKDFETDESRADAPAIQASLALFNEAKKHNIAIFFVTGRREYKRRFTEKNLYLAGYRGWQALIMKPNNYRATSVIPYKSHARQLIESKGYKIALNIGDQDSDLAGGYALKGFKLPNPYYYLP